MTDMPQARPGPRSAESSQVPEGYLDLGALYVPKIPGMQLRGKLEADKTTLRQVLLILGSSGVAVSIAAAPKSGDAWRELAAMIEAGIVSGGGEADEVEGPYGLEIQARIAGQAPNGQKTSTPMRIIGVEGPRWVARIDIQGSAASGDEAQEKACLDLIDQLIINRGSEPRIRLELLPLRLPREAAALNASS